MEKWKLAIRRYQSRYPGCFQSLQLTFNIYNPLTPFVISPIKVFFLIFFRFVPYEIKYESLDLENVFLFVKHSIDAIKTCFVLCFFYTIYQTQKAFCASKVQITFRYRCRCIFHPISIVTFFSIVLFIDTETHDSVIFCFDPVRSSHISLRPYNKINSVLLMFIIDPA